MVPEWRRFASHEESLAKDEQLMLNMHSHFKVLYVA